MWIRLRASRALTFRPIDANLKRVINQRPFFPRRASLSVVVRRRRKTKSAAAVSTTRTSSFFRFLLVSFPPPPPRRKRKNEKCDPQKTRGGDDWPRPSTSHTHTHTHTHTHDRGRPRCSIQSPTLEVDEEIWQLVKRSSQHIGRFIQLPITYSMEITSRWK